LVKAAKKSSGGAVLSDVDRAFTADFADRLAWLIGLFDSQNDAGEAAGVSAEQLRRYIAGARGQSGTAKVPFGVLVRLANAKNVSLDWIAAGSGARFIGGGEAPGPIIIRVPVWNVVASSGPGTFHIREELQGELEFSRAWLLSLNIPLNDLHVVFNSGTSNAPSINDGDAMLIQKGVDRLAADAFYIFDADDVLLVKAIEKRADGSVLLKSRNPEFEPQVVPKNQVGGLHIFGRVVWAGGLI
jgi:phage repressor protein C with HTH and peptisase S24 domain